ncbi:MAG: helix-turn-helix domain-containing protein, partial [Acidobacteriia bacterium]|nr:helix-turn-helix domain-containing protein [Terriglobia bacterium]
MKPGVGPFLRELRASRRVSLGWLATRAGVGKSTLSQWEKGVYQPIISTLESVLDALRATPAQQEHALSLIWAPRAVRRMQKQVEAQAAALGLDDVPLPTRGEFLRALRRRRGLSLEQVARRLGVTPSTVSRWEQAKSVPPPERWEALFAVLGADHEEQAALMGEGMFLYAGPEPSVLDLGALVRELRCLEERVSRGEEALMDLRFFTAEARLWPIIPRHGAARRLLARFYTLHATWLSAGDRHAEAQRYV